MDDDLPFYMYTLSERFSMEDKASFDEPGVGVPRLHRLHQRSREDNTVEVTGRVYLPQRNVTSVRQQVHKQPVDVAPLTSDMQQIVDEAVKNLKK